jgi:hypothetical protein
MRNFFVAVFVIGAALSFIAGFISVDKSFFIIAFLLALGAWLIRSGQH